MILKLSTTGTLGDVPINDLGGVIFSHPTTDSVIYNSEFSANAFNIADIQKSSDLQSAIDNGYIILEDENNNIIQSIKYKKTELYFDNSVVALASGTTPTTTAAIRAGVSVTGVTYIRFRGNAGTNDGCALNFRIPKDYKGSGRFKMLYTSETGIGVFNMKFQFIITKKATGSDLSTITEGSLSTIVPSVTAYVVAETPFITSVTTYTADDLVSIRVYRLADDASDLFGFSSYMIGFIFEYDKLRF